MRYGFYDVSITYTDEPQPERSSEAPGVRCSDKDVQKNFARKV
jgi:hypothetical protein